MNKTPRTDEREFAAMELKPSSRVVYASFARQLETELAEARAEIERLQTELRQIADSCAGTNLEIYWCKACTSRKWCAAGQSLVEAAERGE